MTELAPLGFLLVVIGVILIIISSLSKGDTKIGVGGFIGPFAFGWANDPEMLKWIVALTVIMAIIFMLVALKGYA